MDQYQVRYRSHAGAQGIEVVAVHDKVVFSVIDTTSAKTPDLMAKLEKAYGREITTRTWLTVQRVVRRLEAVA